VLGDKKISEIMTPAPLDSCESSLTIIDAAKIMKSKKRGCLIVLKDRKPVGIFTERDVIRRVVAENSDLTTTKVASVMSSPIISVLPDDTISEVAKLLYDRGIRRTVVMKKDLILGIVTSTDIVRAFVTEGGKDIQYFKAMLRSSAAWVNE
jgi:CBS domain-containing protein